MRLTVTASTGAQTVVWQQGGTYFARPTNEPSEPQVCLAVDLFEVIAELASLDLEDREQAAEALALAEDAQRRSRPREVRPSDHDVPVGAGESITADNQGHGS